MIPITQTKFGYPEGNCFASCIASIFELPLDVFPPHPTADVNPETNVWYEFWSKWLRQHNVSYLSVPTGGENWEWKPQGFVIGAGISPRTDETGYQFHHAVVCLDGRVVHDPHPSRAGLRGYPEYWDIFYPIDPSKPTFEKLRRESSVGVG